MKIRKQWILLAGLMLLALMLGACSPATPVTVGGGTPRSAPSGTQVAARPVETLKGLGGKDCRFEFADQGILALCKIEVTRAEVLAVPGLNQAVMKGLLKIAIWVTANQALTLEPVAQADPVAWVIPWSVTAQARTDALVAYPDSSQAAQSGELEIDGGTIRAELVLSADGCTASLYSDFRRTGSQKWQPMWTVVESLSRCYPRIEKDLIDEIRELLFKEWGYGDLGNLLRELLEAVAIGLKFPIP